VCSGLWRMHHRETPSKGPRSNPNPSRCGDPRHTTRAQRGNLYNSEATNVVKIKFEIMNPPAARRPARRPRPARPAGNGKCETGPVFPRRLPRLLTSLKVISGNTHTALAGTLTMTAVQSPVQRTMTAEKNLTKSRSILNLKKLSSSRGKAYVPALQAMAALK